MDNKEKNFISAVIYVHNAEKRIGRFLKAIIGVMENNFEHSEIICVNDSSDDGSLEAIRNTSADAIKTNVSVVNMSYFHGLELAMNAGVDMAIGDFVLEFDNTRLDYDTNFIMNIYRRSLEGYDIVCASPDKKEKLTSKIFYLVFERFANLTYEMSTESFRILSRRVINRIESMNKIVVYRKAMYANCGLKTDTMKYSVKKDFNHTADRKERNYRIRVATDSLILYTEMGYRFSMWMTILMMLITIVIAVYTCIIYFTSHPVEGWTTTILFLSICFFGLFGITTIVVKYLQLIVTMLFKARHYSFESIEKLTK